MRHIQEWLLFGIQFVIKAGFLGQYKLVSTATPEPNNKLGLKILERTILSLGKKNDTLNATLMSAKDKIATLEKDVVEAHKTLDYMTTQLAVSDLENTSLKKEIEVWVDRDSKWAESLQNEKVSFQKEIASLNSTLEQATTLSERLQGEMKKWRT